jgi:hypothetical protein
MAKREADRKKRKADLEKMMLELTKKKGRLKGKSTEKWRQG